LPSSGRSAAVREATEADRFGPAPVGVAVIRLTGLTIRTDHNQTRDGHRLAPQGILPLLEVKSRHGRRGRPRVAAETIQLIRRLSRENPHRERRAFTENS